MTGQRLPTLDGLRGVAVMGILLMNIVSFALPPGAYFNPHAWGTPSRADLALWAAAFVLVDGKMRALFSILFGASLAILARRAEDTDTDPARAHFRRMAALAMLGIAHGVLLWPGDILLHYALVGCLALPIAGLEARQQLRLAVPLLGGQALIQAALIAGDVPLRDAGGADWVRIAASMGVAPPAAVAPAIAVQRGPWPDLVAAQAQDMLNGVPVTLVFDGLETLAFMAIGMAALSSGLLTGGWPRRASLRLGTACLGVGLPLSALLAWLAAQSGFETIMTFAASTLGGIPLRPLVAIGYAALLLPWLGGTGRLRARIQAAGRMALSNYLLTSLAMSALFDGWGLSRFAHWSRAQSYGVVPWVWAAMLAWSAPWLRHYRYGPCEWLWRSLAAGRPLPIRRNKAIATA